MEKTSRDLLSAMIAKSIEDVCRHWGIDVEHFAPSPARDLEIVAVIGFAGDTLRGSMGVGVQRSFLRRLLFDVPDRMSEDWLGEATNQLLGRTKNRLYVHGAQVSVAVPTVLRGLRIQLMPGDSELLTFPVTTSAGPMTVWFDAQPEPSFRLRTPVEGHERCAAEGEIVLF